MSTVVQEMLERNVGKVKHDESVLAELLFGSETRGEELTARWVSGLASAILTAIALDSMQTKVYDYTHKEVYRMRTNIVLDDDLVQEALKLSGAKTKKELVREALKEFVENRRRLDLRDLAGKVRFAARYDYKKLREGK